MSCPVFLDLIPRLHLSNVYSHFPYCFPRPRFLARALTTRDRKAARRVVGCTCQMVRASSLPGYSDLLLVVAVAGR